jgi:hypothetical protein
MDDLELNGLHSKHFCGIENEYHGDEMHAERV